MKRFKKFKIFSSDDFDILSEQVNNFLIDGPVRKILFMAQSECIEEGYLPHLTISILYEY